MDRAYSHYWFRARIENYSGSFEEFLVDYPEAIDWGFYARHLRSYTARFDRDTFSILIFERAFEDTDATLKQLGEALGVDSAAFPDDVARARVNRRFVPRHRGLYASSFSLARRLVRPDFYGVVRWVKLLGIMRVLGKEGDVAIHVPMKAYSANLHMTCTIIRTPMGHRIRARNALYTRRCAMVRCTVLTTKFSGMSTAPACRSNIRARQLSRTESRAARLLSSAM